jgi:hypothetical protein
MTQPKKSPLTRKVILLATLGLCIPVFLVGMAFLALKSDAENQKKYQQQRLEQAQKIAERERTAKEQK